MQPTDATVESPLLEELAQHKLVTIFPLKLHPRLLRFFPFLISGPLKVLWQVGDLVTVLGWKTKHSTWILVQNPPSIPTLAVAVITCFARRTRLLIDWHNYGWSILAGTRGAKHPFVRVSKTYETFFGRLGSANLAVTAAMARQLRGRPYGIRSPIKVLHDRPAALFRPLTSASERLHVLARILGSKETASAIVDGHARLVVSSTSWTPDEDFQTLLYALVQYCARQSLPGRPRRPPLVVVITGKGPQKDMYLTRLAKLRRAGQLDGVEVETAFLPIDDYASLLAAADLGVCLHTSSSGVDLPMKVVDMFGAGLPVVAYSDYESFPELVKDGVNGRGFKTSGGLSDHLAFLLGAAGADELKHLKEGAMRESSLRWDEEWDKVVAPLLGFDPDGEKK